MKSSVDMMNRNKSAGADGVVNEISEALCGSGSNKNTEVIYEIYNCENAPKELSKCIFLALPKKYGAE